MLERLHSWWQKAKKPLEIVVVIVACIVVIALLVKIAQAYLFNMKVPGLSGKTLWDWLQLLIIPAVLAVGGYAFNLANTRTEQRIAAQRYENDQHLALDRQREDLLQAYLDRMSELLLDRNLRVSSPDTEVRNVARVRTTTILFQLDARRIGFVFSFLRESGLMSSESDGSVVSFNEANLERVNFSGADLTNVNLAGASLLRANMSYANLYQANLSRANLNGAILRYSGCGEVNLAEAHLYQADLTKAFLRKANLAGADLDNAKLSKASLGEANLTGASLKNAYLERCTKGLICDKLEA